MGSSLLVVLGIVLASTPAAADRELCTPGAKYRGATLDLDVKDADIKDVFRLLADVGKVNLVVPDDVSGRVTLRLKRVPWDQVACTVAAVHKLTITVQGAILMIARRR
ncbi:MAG: hypothetical protein H0T42_17330 [Deltaproteobacteria bacterium]|nr:hypothetical protein [Deltaproteobacteria bacterium]